MNFFKDVLPLLFSLAAIGFTIYLCWLFSKMLARKAAAAQSTRNIKIVERVALSQDKGLFIADVAGKTYLFGFSGGGVNILKELDKDALIPAETNQEPDFSRLFIDSFRSNAGKLIKKAGKMTKDGNDNEK
ncbi:MAG: flagellar biosynthetic protein FliO [Bacillota bacterium]|nr:flagellar biosynthetic protein FliO [Bacillota bacterium]